MKGFCQKNQLVLSSCAHRQRLLITNLASFAVFLIAFCQTQSTSAQGFNPCNGKALLDERCDFDSDCEIKGSICLRQKCQCHPYYQKVAEKNGATRCARLPAKIGQECQNKCREPLFCRNGLCQCVQRGSTSVLNGECVSISKVGDRCSRHYDCTAPFSACVNQQCVCISGTIQQGSKCVASTNCPLGGSPSDSCIRRALPHQISNFVDQADTCPLGQFCVTSPDSPIGHCCPAVCPLGSTVDASYTCLPGSTVASSVPPTPTAQISPAATVASFFSNRDTPPPQSPFANLTNRLFLSTLFKQQPCPSETHFCHYISGDTFAQAVCCKRPCNSMSPYSLYLNGECVARGQLNSDCRSHEQCGAAEGMSCMKGTCQCISGFSAFVDLITHPAKNPSQQCVRDCDKSVSLSRDTSCLGKTQLGGPCFVQEQCPENSGCYRGKCLCRCGFRQTALNKCTPTPRPTTQQPPPQPIVPGLLPNQGGNFFNIIGDLFGGGGRGR